MIRKALMIGLFTCLGLVLTGVTLLANHENRYYEILRLKKESERIPEAERKAKAMELAAKVFHKYQTTESLSFKADIVGYWCTEGTWKSRLPLDWWPLRSVGTFRMMMIPGRFKTDVSVKGKPLYTFLAHEGKFYEFKWPWNGIPGMRTEYTLGRPGTRLRRGVDPYLLCEAGAFRSSWVGPDSGHPAKLEGNIEGGLWIGSTEVQGKLCDLVLCQWEDDPGERRWDVYYVDSEGFVVIWNMINARFGKYPDRLLWIIHYTGFATDPIRPEDLLPSEALLQEAQTWRTLTESEARAESEGE